MPRKDPWFGRPYVLFYDHEITPTNPISLACFSQWYPASFSDPSYPDIVFPTTEHYMMYGKALLFDPALAPEIIKAKTPSEAKELGRKVRNFDKEVWNKHADDIVEKGNYHKFGQNEELKKIVLDTEGKTLVEASPVDRIWGIGYGVDDAEGKEDQWGANRMGLALTRARDTLAKQANGQ